MSSGDITRYVVIVKIHEDSLTELNEITNHFSRGGFFSRWRMMKETFMTWASTLLG